MQTALICDSQWIDEELPQFKHLVVGLLDEQVHAVQILPPQTGINEISLFGEKLPCPEMGGPRLRRWQLRRMASSLAERNITLVHALDSRSWSGAVDLASKLTLPVVLNVDSGHDLARTAKIHRRLDPSRIAWVASTTPLARGLKDVLGQSAFIQTVRFGVHLPPPPPLPAPQHVPCMVVTGNGRWDTDYDCLFKALRQVIEKHTQTQIFLDGQRQDQHRLWKEAKKQGLLSNLSLVPRQLGHREMLLRADLLIQPQALGTARCLTLGAMARGIAILAKTDPQLDYLVDDQTAWLIDKASPSLWAQKINTLLTDRSQSSRLGVRGREWIDEHHIPAKQVQQILAIYRRISGESFKFPQQADSHS